MAEKTDYAALQRLSAGRWENERTARVDALAEALVATRAAERALPTGRALPSGRRLVDLAPVAAALRGELRAELTATNPFVASRRTRPPPRPRGVASAGYDPDGNSPDPRG
jgi:hypothetical protein